jgi:hypothetical protein
MPVEPLTQEKLDAISPGVRSAVRWLREHGFETVDSGDGTHYAAGMEGAMPFPHVCMVVEKGDMLAEVERLHDLLGEGHGLSLEANYSPVDGNAILLLTAHEGSDLLERLG